MCEKVWEMDRKREKDAKIQRESKDMLTNDAISTSQKQIPKA